MRKLVIGGIIMSLLGGCADAVKAEASAKTEAVAGKVAVVYFSWSPDGNTRYAAQKIAEAAGGDIFRIEAAKPYSSNYSACCDEAKPECYGKQLREIKPLEIDLAKYDVVFVGTPNWWGTMAPPVRTWTTQNAEALKKCKAVSLFLTHGGGGMQRVGAEFAALLEGANILDAKAFPGSRVHKMDAELAEFAGERVK